MNDKTGIETETHTNDRKMKLICSLRIKHHGNVLKVILLLLLLLLVILLLQVSIFLKLFQFGLHFLFKLEENSGINDLA